MANARQNQSKPRVVVTVDAQNYRQTTIDLAVEMASLCNSSLHGLFIEDIDLLNIADLPFSCEVTLTTGQQRSLDFEKLQQTFNNLANQFRQQLARKAEQRSVEWTYSSVRGRKRDIPSDAFYRAQYLIVEQSSIPPSVKDPLGKLKRILLIENQSANLHRVLGLLSDKYGEAGIELYVAQSDNKLSQGKTMEKKPLPTTLKTTIKPVAMSQIEPLLRNKYKPFDYVIAARSDNPEHLKKVIGWSSCPVIVVD